MSTTALAIITDAFQTLGVYQPGESIPNDAAAVALSRLQEMQKQWAFQPLTAPINTREEFSLVAGQGGPENPYTIGPGGNFNTTRPATVAEITGWGLLIPGTSPSVEIPRAMLTIDAFQAIQIKDLQNPLYTDAYYNPTYAGGLGSIILWPVPNDSTYSIFLYRNRPIATVTTLTASYDLPDGYFRALSDNLAVQLAVPFAQEARLGVLVPMAQMSLGHVKRMNTRMSDLPTDPALTHDRRGGYNIQTGLGS